MEINVRYETDIQARPKTGDIVHAMKAVVTGSLGEGVFGAVAAVLAIIGLVKFYPQILLPIAALSIGVSMIFEGGSIATRINTLTDAVGKESDFKTAEIGIGMTSEFLGGIIATFLSILALLGVAPLILVPVAVAVFGVVLIFSSGLTARLNDLEIQCASESDVYRSVTHEAVSAAEKIQFLIGLGAIVLGVLALMDIMPLVLSLVAALAIGASNFVSGSAISARLSSAYRTC